MSTEFTQEQIRQIEDLLVERLPELLRRDPKIAVTIEGILAQHFPRRDEFARLLDEVKALREEMNERFGQVDQRFDQVDQRLDQVDQRFDQVDQRFDQMDQGLSGLKQDVQTLKRNVAQLQHGQEMILKQLNGQEAWLRLTIGDLRNERGANLEHAFAAGLRHGLKDPDISADKLRLRQPLVDSDGAFLPKGFSTEVDLIAEDGVLIVFEIKATAKRSDLDFFWLKVKLVQAQNPEKSVRGTFISLGAPELLQERAAELDIELVG